MEGTGGAPWGDQNESRWRDGNGGFGGPEMEQREGGGGPKFKPGKIELMGIQKRSRRLGLGFSRFACLSYDSRSA